MYQFYLPIGDWSDDGHGHHEKFLINSDVPVERVREAHFRIKEVTGLDIEKICAQYGEDTIAPDVERKLEALDIPFVGGSEPIPVDDMAKLWLSLLQLADPEIHLEIGTSQIPMLPFSGFDEQGRHIGQVGYGLF